MERTDPLVIDVAGHPDLEQLVAKVAEGRDCTLVREGRRVAVVTAATSSDPWNRPPGWKPSAEDIAAFESAAGAWKDLDADKMIEDIYRWRDESPTKPMYEL